MHVKIIPMKKFKAKIIVTMKPTVKDVKGLTLQHAIESYMYIDNLSCNVGSVYFLEFDSRSEADALKTVENISKDLLANEVIETYEIKSLEEI